MVEMDLKTNFLWAKLLTANRDSELMQLFCLDLIMAHSMANVFCFERQFGWVDYVLHKTQCNLHLCEHKEESQ